jgi:uncharacterized membrane protein
MHDHPGVRWNRDVSEVLPTPDSMEARIGESRWPPLVAVLVFVILNIVLRLWLPSDRTIAVPWLVPTLEICVILVLAFSDPKRLDARAHTLRRITIALVVLLVLAALWSTAILIDHLIRGDPQTNSGGKLLAAGALIYLGNVVAFSLLYWIFDGGGPARRTHAPREYPDFAFPQLQNPELVPDGWHPVYFDYLYLAFCTSTAFSPTDVLPLAHWGKGAMALQSAVSLALLGLVIARAVNVLA